MLQFKRFLIFSGYVGKRDVCEEREFGWAGVEREGCSVFSTDSVEVARERAKTALVEVAEQYGVKEGCRAHIVDLQSGNMIRHFTYFDRSFDPELFSPDAQGVIEW